MNRAKIHRVLALVCLIFTVLQDCNASLEDWETSEKCVNLKMCEPVMRLLRIQMIKKKIYKEVRQAFCGYEGSEFKIYCDVNKIIHKPERFESVVAAHSTGSMTTAIPSTINPLLTSIDKHPNFQLLDHEICGSVSQNYKNQVKVRILGGKVTAIDEFPWMALLAYHEENDKDGQLQFRCGATVINKNHVMTAAHCVTNINHLKLLGVRIGEYDLSKEEDCDDKTCNAKHIDFGIDKVYPHPEYSTDTLYNDIAIIRLNGSIDFTQTQVRPICLPIEPEQKIPKRGIVTGWGSTEEDSPGSNVLLKVPLPIVPAEECKDIYFKSTPSMEIWYKQFCAGGILSMDSCTGDSGGPFQMIAKYRGKIRVVQQGIVSYGRKFCGLENSPGVYTGVEHYVNWILDTIRR